MKFSRSYGTYSSSPSSSAITSSKSLTAAPVPSKTGRDLVILGRDFLWTYKFVYDGPNGTIWLSTIE